MRQVSRARDAGMDPIMELWVDDRKRPVRISMVGRLDSSTSPSLLALLDQLLAEGVRQFLMDAGELDIGDAWGATALSVLQQCARDAGWSLIWEGLHLSPRNPLARGNTLETKSEISSRPPRSTLTYQPDLARLLDPVYCQRR
jgi:anti-anti-sigma regulatory factor